MKIDLLVDTKEKNVKKKTFSYPPSKTTKMNM